MMVGIKVGLTQMSGGIRLIILSSVPSICRVSVIRSGVHTSEHKVFDKIVVTKHICRNGFMSDYEMWVFHGK
jgi:hypothetical protein